MFGATSYLVWQYRINEFQCLPDYKILQTDIYWHYSYNTNCYLKMYIFTVPMGHKNDLSCYISDF